MNRPNLLLPDNVRWTPEKGDIVALDHVTTRFGDHVVLDDLSLHIPVGKTTVIIGESGSGKSVLIKTMNGLLKPTSGVCHLFGEDTAKCDTAKINALRMRTGMILQDYALIDSISVCDNIGFPLAENTKMSETEIRKRVEEALEPLGLSDAIDKLPSELSGGMKKRVSFARALIHQPELVFFDEPTTGLDPVMIVFVDQLIRQMREMYDLTSVITITIDGDEIESCGDTIIFAEKGLTKEVDFSAELESSSHGVSTISYKINQYANKFGKSRIVIVKSQMGQPLMAFSGNKVYWEIVTDLPRTTKLMIDGKALYIHRANFQIIDADLLG